LQPPKSWSGEQLELRRIGNDGRVMVKTLERDDNQCNTVKLLGHDGPITAAAFSPDHRRLVMASEDRTARIWEVPSGRLHQVLRGHVRRINGVAVSPAGGQVVTASDVSVASLSFFSAVIARNSR
jgi:WD40 repeat protein